MAISPSTDNYRIPAAQLKMKKPGDATYSDAGNLVDFVYTPDVQKKEHFSGRNGIRGKDKTVITQVGASIKFTLDEFTARNISLFLLAEVEEDEDGNEVIIPLTAPDMTIDIQLVATNSTGPLLDFEGNVTLSPSGDLSLMADNDDFAQIPLTADVNKKDGNFGKFTLRQQPVVAP